MIHSTLNYLSTYLYWLAEDMFYIYNQVPISIIIATFIFMILLSVIVTEVIIYRIKNRVRNIGKTNPQATIYWDKIEKSHPLRFGKGLYLLKVYFISLLYMLPFYVSGYSFYDILSSGTQGDALAYKNSIMQVIQHSGMTAEEAMTLYTESTMSLCIAVFSLSFISCICLSLIAKFSELEKNLHSHISTP